MAVVEAPEGMVGVELLRVAAVEEVAPSSMVETVLAETVAVVHFYAAAQAVTTIMAMVPLAPAAAVVEENPLAASSPSMEEMEPMAPTVAVGLAAASACQSRARTRAAVAATAGLAGAGAPQEQSSLPSLALMEEMADLAAAQASASAPALICTALPETGVVSEGVVTAVAVAAGVELSEAPSSIKAVQL